MDSNEKIDTKDEQIEDIIKSKQKNKKLAELVRADITEVDISTNTTVRCKTPTE